jgi:putative ABC transport system permease protein
MIFNAFLIALREIRRNLTRSFLTVVGIVIGVAAVITMVNVGQLGRSAIQHKRRQRDPRSSSRYRIAFTSGAK